MRQAGPTSGAAARVLRVDCLLTKEGPNRITICLSVLHQTERKPERLSLTRTLSWDDLPREVRSGFIHTGKRELAFVLCESEQGGKKTTTDQNKS